MAARRRKSDADRMAEALEETLRYAPSWAGPLLAVALFLFLWFAVPRMLSLGSEAFGTALAPVSRMGAPIVGLLVLVIWGVAESKKRSRRRLFDSRSGPKSLRSLSWREFEQLVGEAYYRQGYVVEEHGGGGADGGVDLVLRKAGETTLVQCKHWRTSKVGVKIVRELYGVMAAEKAARGIVVTCGRFTRDARDFAEGKPLALVDGPALWQLMASVKAESKASHQRRGAVAESGSETTAPPAPVSQPPKCPDCGSPMVVRTARKGPRAGSQFYGCTRYPQCRGIRDIQTAPTAGTKTGTELSRDERK